MFRIVALSYDYSKRLCHQEIIAKSSQSLEGCVSGRCERLADLVDCKGDVWAVLQEMSENAHTPVISTSVSFTQSWLVFVALLLTRLDNRSRHRFALVVAETQDVQKFLM